MLRTNLESEREMQEAHEKDLLGHFKESTRKMRKIIAQVLKTLAP